MSKEADKGIGMRIVEFSEVLDLGAAAIGAGLIVVAPFFPQLAILGADMVIGGGTLFALKRGTLHGGERK